MQTSTASHLPIDAANTLMSYDWLSLTIWKTYAEIEKYLAVLGLVEGLEHSGHGSQGFHQLYVGTAAFSLSAEPVNGGEFCSLQFPGQACAHVGVDRMRELVTLLVNDRVRFRASRFDVTLDTQQFEVAAVAAARAAGQVQCAAKKFYPFEEWDGDELVGHTLYFGSRKSQKMLRVYLKTDGDSFGSEPFTRLEMEYKGKQAEMQFLQLMAFDLADWLTIAAASLRGFLDISADWWRDWLGAIPCWSIKIRRPVQTLKRALTFLREQVAPTFAAVMMALTDGDVDLMHAEFRKYLSEGAKRMRPRHRRLVKLPPEPDFMTYAWFPIG